MKIESCNELGFQPICSVCNDFCKEELCLHSDKANTYVCLSCLDEMTKAVNIYVSQKQQQRQENDATEGLTGIRA